MILTSGASSPRQWSAERVRQTTLRGLQGLGYRQRFDESRKRAVAVTSDVRSTDIGVDQGFELLSHESHTPFCRTSDDSLLSFPPGAVLRTSTASRPTRYFRSRGTESQQNTRAHRGRWIILCRRRKAGQKSRVDRVAQSGRRGVDFGVSFTT